MGRDTGDRTGQRLARLTGFGALSHDAEPVAAQLAEPIREPFPWPVGRADRPRLEASDADETRPGAPGAHGRDRRGRHAAGQRGGSRGDSPPGTRWRLAGVPPAVAVGLLAVAVVVVLLLGRGDGAQEVLLGPAAATYASPAPDSAGHGTPTVVPLEPVAGGARPTSGALAGGEATATPVGGVVGPGSAGPVLVHVDGAVHRPGVVALRPGDRVADAVEAAGGVTADADTRLVNLARTVVDGELVVLPAQGEEPALGPVGSPGAGADDDGGSGSTDGAAAPGLVVDLNAADAAALESLPGIGPVLAERVVAWREESGPFAAVDDLSAVRGIGPAVLAGLRDLVTV